jgi:hypothetical protein
LNPGPRVPPPNAERDDCDHGKRYDDRHDERTILRQPLVISGIEDQITGIEAVVGKEQ